MSMLLVSLTDHIAICFNTKLRTNRCYAFQC